MKTSAPAVVVVVILAALLNCLAIAQPQNHTCPPDSYWSTQWSTCHNCMSCRDSEAPACEAKCFCTSSSQCQPRIGHCGVVNYGETPERQLCQLCEGSCGAYDSTYWKVLPSEAPVPGSPDCPTSCLCTAHSQCPTGYFCGRSSRGTPNVCRKCDRCTNVLAVDGSCPGTNCAATIQCRSNAACKARDSSAGSWCTAGLQCQSCSSSCYTAKRSRAQYAEYTFASLTGMCPQSCCGWTTLEQQAMSYPQFMYGLCDSEKYTGFAAFWTDDVTKAFPRDQAAARRSHWHSCTVTVDQNTNGYPRKVPLFECNYISNCQKGERMIVVFAEEGAVTHTLATRNWTVNTRSDSCALSDALPILLAILIIGVLIACCFFVCVSVCIAKCCLAWSRSRQAPGTIVAVQAVPVTVATVPPEQEMAPREPVMGILIESTEHDRVPLTSGGKENQL